MAAPKLNATKNYDLFHRSAENRELDIKKHASLEESMRKYGFLKSFPISCVRDEHGRLTVRDGQHRLAIGRTLGLPVYWIEEDIDYDVAAVSMTPKVWRPIDYAKKHAANGLDDYAVGLKFAEDNRLPVALAFALLAGTTNYTNIAEQFYAGSFAVKDRKWADAVAGVYTSMLRLCPRLRNVRFLLACMSVSRVRDFDAKRLIGGASRCVERLQPYSNLDGYLGLLEEVYNFGRSVKYGLKVAAQNAMRSRNPKHKPRRDPTAA